MSTELDTRAYRKLLLEIADLCDHATLTGSMASGARRTAERYNAVVTRLGNAGEIPTGLFEPLPETADFGEIGVEARMLGGYLSDGDKRRYRDDKDESRSIIVRLAPFIGQAELRDLVQQHAKRGKALDPNTITALAPFLGQEYLSEIVREHLLKPEHAERPADPSAAPQSSTSEPDRTPAPIEPNEQGIGHLLDMLQDSSLPELDRREIIERIRIATG